MGNELSIEEVKNIIIQDIDKILEYQKNARIAADPKFQELYAGQHVIVLNEGKIVHSGSQEYISKILKEMSVEDRQRAYVGYVPKKDEIWILSNHT